MTKTDIVILAAGKGTRMQSALPKVLHKLAGKPLLGHVLDAAAALGDCHNIVVTGHGGDAVRALYASSKVTLVEQTQQLGTGHAVLTAAPAVPGPFLVCNADDYYGRSTYAAIAPLAAALPALDVSEL